MSKILYEGTEYVRSGTDTVFEVLNRHGVPVPSSCRSGICQTCLLRAVDGVPPAESQKGLKDTLVAQGYFMSCVCRPEADLEVALPGKDITHQIKATVVNRTLLNNDILQLGLASEEMFDYRPGQFLHLFRQDGLVRNYSIASLPRHKEPLELHIRRVEGGKMTTWLHDAVNVGDALEIAGPAGNCFYTPGKPQEPILLVGTGCGLAPLVGILRDALDHDHEGPIYLFHGSYTREGLYLVDEMRFLAQKHPNFYYVPCVDRADNHENGFAIGRVDDVVSSKLPDLKGWKVFVCGHPDMVKIVKRKTFLAGASLQDIYSDAFVSAPEEEESEKFPASAVR